MTGPRPRVRAIYEARARTEKARPTADADAFQPTDADVIGTLNVPPVIDRQGIEPKGSGDLVAGGFEDDAETRTPGVEL